MAILFSEPRNDLRIWDGGIAIYGGLIGAAITLIIFCKHRGISAWEFLDIVAPTVIMAQGIGRWGNFVNQEAHGVATSLAFLQNTLHLPHFIVQQCALTEHITNRHSYMNLCGILLDLFYWWHCVIGNNCLKTRRSLFNVRDVVLIRPVLY